MNEEQVRESIIVADCGRALTRATLVEIVEGACRFVAQGTSPSTIERPDADLGVGLRGALVALEAATTRRFANRTRIIRPQEETGDGTDAFLSTVAVGPPLRVAILAAGGSATLNALLAIVRRAPVTSLPTLTIDPRAALDEAARKTVAALSRLRPDFLLIIAPAEESQGLSRLLGLAMEIMGPPPSGDEIAPAILVIAGESGREQSTNAFGNGYEFGFLATNEHEPGTIALTVETELLDLANRRASAVVPGFENLEGMSDAPPLARARALDLVNRFMAVRFGCAVMTVDLDEGFTCCWAKGGEGRALSEPTLDLALGAANLLTALTLADVSRWLPFSMGDDELREWILNRALRPFTIPVSVRDRQIEAALVRELLRTGATELASGGQGPLTPELLVGGGFFVRWPDPVDIFMVLIDGLDPQPVRGVTQIALDRDALLPPIGALGALEPERATELFDHDSLFDLGAYVLLDCPDNEWIKGELVYQDGRIWPFDVRAGGLLRLPLPSGERAASLRFIPSKRARIGAGEVGKEVTWSGDDAPHGGTVGLVIDARPRPLTFPQTEQERSAAVANWHTEAHTISQRISAGPTEGRDNDQHAATEDDTAH